MRRPERSVERKRFSRGSALERAALSGFGRFGQGGLAQRPLFRVTPVAEHLFVIPIDIQIVEKRIELAELGEQLHCGFVIFSFLVPDGDSPKLSRNEVSLSTVVEGKQIRALCLLQVAHGQVTVTNQQIIEIGILIGRDLSALEPLSDIELVFFDRLLTLSFLSKCLSIK